MKRRNFLKNISAGVALPSLLSGLGVRAYASNPYSQLLHDFNIDTDHVLVIIQLEGGNDGLGTLVPLDQYDHLYNGRASVLLPENSLLPLTNNLTLGMHPALSGLHSLYNDGKVRIIQNVGYPNPSLSHFRATDIWMSGSDADEYFPSGWAGRYLSYEYPNFPIDYPNPDVPHPLAIEIGNSISLTLMGPQSGMGYVIPSTGDFYNLLAGVQDPAPNTPAGEQLAYVRLIAQQSREYAQSIIDASDMITDQKIYPDTPLAAKLKVVSRLIAGGLQTRVYIVSIGGFDTHDQQVDPNDHTVGEHANLLSQLGDAIKAFMDDLDYLGTAERVIGMTFSEFGRRIISNFSGGTDHGEAAPMFLFGKSVAGGVTGANPQIPQNPNVLDNLPMEIDFRSVYASVLRDWFCVPESDIPGILLHDLPYLNLFPASLPCVSTSVHDANQLAGKALLKVWPNPFRTSATLEYETSGGMTLVQLLDSSGRIVATPVNTWQPAGTYQAHLEASQLAPGAYYCRLITDGQQQTKPVVKIR
ncbi:MAG: DUF1501 domain-containing protein [Bacteroidetes bacterium]|nr:MAG: DUF1501 domain-containing protein [Bacteroidota bacterium]